jgi:hypothetical protein
MPVGDTGKIADCRCAIAELPGKGNGKANLIAFDVYQRVDV